jgi:hypothetical protein
MLKGTKTVTLESLSASISSSATLIKNDFPVPLEPSSKQGSEDFRAPIIIKSDELTTDRFKISVCFILSVRR